jgi:hypothetical protein
MGSSSSSSLNNSPIRADSMVTPESQMTVNDNKNDNVSILSPSVKKSFESPRKSTSIPANNNLTPVKSRWSFSSSKKSFGIYSKTKIISFLNLILDLGSFTVSPLLDYWSLLIYILSYCINIHKTIPDFFLCL